MKRRSTRNLPANGILYKRQWYGHGLSERRRFDTRVASIKVTTKS